MKLKDLKIGTQLILAFSIMLLFVITLSYISFQNNKKLQNQTNIFYEYPFIVNTTVGELKSNILQMRLSTRDLMLAENESEQQEFKQNIEIAANAAEENFAILHDKYLGPKIDVKNAHEAFIVWNTTRKDNIKLIIQGNISKARINVKKDELVGRLREDMIKKIDVISLFSSNKAISLNNDSKIISQTLNQTILTLTLILLLSIILIGFYIIGNIKKPIKALTKMMLTFKTGNRNIENNLKPTNEFGIMFDTFFEMLEQIDEDDDLTKKTNELAEAMTIEDDSHAFFKELLPKLATHTNSQIATVYLYYNKTKNFKLYESVGISEKQIIQSFDAESREGEFGHVILNKHIQYVKNIPIETGFVFNSIAGTILPREIVSIPILSKNNNVLAIISLASLNSYSSKNSNYINKIFDVLTARTLGVLAYRDLRKASRILGEQQAEMAISNKELESQKVELTTQSEILKQQNAELEVQKNQLNEVSRLKTNFLSNMSHELRTPLNSVIALSGVLTRRLIKTIPDDEYSYIQVIERNGKHLLSLINDILDISRIEAGREEIEIETVSIKLAIKDIVELINPQIDHKKVNIILKNQDPEIFIESDSHKIKHILQNLVGNAAKFTEKGNIEIHSEVFDDKIQIHIKDTGIGISQENIAHIFDEFRQADGSTSRKFGGTGLGLAIAKKYAILLGGDVTVESIIDQGSIFTLSLPIKFDNKLKVEKTENKITLPKTSLNNYDGQISANGKKILLVEDSEPAVIQIKDFLEQSGYQITVAKTGFEALEIVSKTKPDGIILDLMMPEIDGFKVLQTIREAETTAQIPVLILSAKHITKDELRFLTKNNIHQLIQKGDVNKTELLNAIASMVVTTEIKDPALTKKVDTSNKKPSVLIVEDNADNMLTVKAIIADRFTIIEAIDGVEAIEKAKSHIPDFILMDIAMPNKDGITAFKEIRANAKLKSIPVIALTASAMTSDKEIILSHGFDAYLAKPIDEIQFYKTINEVLYGK